MPDSPRGLRELPLQAAQELPGLWVSGCLGEASTQLPTPLGWHLVLDDADLLGRALADRGASLPRLSRRLVRVGGFAYHAFVPLSRAARALAPLDPLAFALAVAGEARAEAQWLAPARTHISAVGRGQLLLQSRRHLGKLERAVLRHERDAAQHHRWLAEMDLGILPDDALGTTLEECAAIRRVTRRLEIDATLDLLMTYGALASFVDKQRAVGPEALAAAALVPDPLELPSATPALAMSCVAQVEMRRRALGERAGHSRALDEFLEGFGERGWSEFEPAAARWREQPQTVVRLGELIARGGPERSEQRMARARSEREATLRRALEAYGPIDAAIVRALSVQLQKLVVLRSRLNSVRVRTLSMLRTAVLDVDRRLARLIKSEPGSAFFLGLRELLDSTVRPRPELSALARERRAAWVTGIASAPPPALLGRAPRAAEDDGKLKGVGIGEAEVAGAAVVTSDFERALQMPARSVLVTRSLDVGWAPLYLSAAAVVTDAGGLTDEGTILASALGVPLVVGTVDGTRRIADGAPVRVDCRSGTVVHA